jgi:polygalacturonase
MPDRTNWSRSRREFLTAAATTGAGVVLAGRAGLGAWLEPQAAPAGWALADSILARIKPPTFPNRDFDITKFGAKPDGVTDASAAIRAAIAACATAKGGRVVVPAGRFLTGPIHLASRVNLHVAEGATLLFERDPKAYLPVVLTRFEGMELMNYSPFIYAFDAEDVAITGRGTLDGQGDAQHWWLWARGGGTSTQAVARARLIDQVSKGVPVADRVYGDGAFMRPNFIQPYRCRNVLIESVTIVNSPMWEIHPVLSTNVTIRDVSIRSHGPNNDGCDPESCRDVLIDRCTFDTGDDCIALKSGRNDDGRRVNVPVENVIVRDCVMKDGHGGVTIGSEISGGARNIFALRCKMDSPQLDRALRFKNNAVRGGVVEHIYMRDCVVGQVAEAVVAADFFYEEGDKGTYTPVLRDVEVRNVTSQKSRYALLLRGYANAPISDVRLVDCTFDGVAEPDRLEGVRDITLTNVRVNGTIRNDRISRIP